MAVMELIFGTPTKAQIGIVQLDASIDEVHTDDAEITDHPVEEGSDISDHIRKLPPTIQINGIVTDTPIAFLASATASSPLTTNIIPSLGTRSFDAYQELLTVMEMGETVDVITSLRDYELMAIKNLSVNRNKDKGKCLDVTITLRQITIASSLTMDLPVPRIVANKLKKNKGKKPPQTGSDAQTSKAQSMLSSLFG